MPRPFKTAFTAKIIKNTAYFRLFAIIANNKCFAKIINLPVFYNNKSKNTLFFKI